MAIKIALFCLLFLWSPLVSSSSVDEPFDVRQHLSTVSSYSAVRASNSDGFEASKIPDECSVVHLNLVARHGTRAPTRKRIKELDELAIKLEALLSDARHEAQGNAESLQRIPGWLWGWKSPWKGRLKGGELISKGEDELYDLGIRVRDRFPELFSAEYHPDIYTITATQVPRASASAVAFGMGLFSGRGSLGSGKHRAFSVISESRASDICLRFFDRCQTYKEFRKKQEPAVDKLKEPVLHEVSSALVARFKLNFTKQDTASLWFLCKQEASLLNITNQACGLFSPYEVSLLEWTDDLEGFILKGYGKAVNYRMGVPLLQDVVESIEQAIIANEGNHVRGTFEKARLRFAHAETVVPFSCLLGLFLHGSGFEQIQREEPLELPPKPPLERSWRGSIVAPFAGNNMLVLYSCPANSTGNDRGKYYVQVLHNENPVPMPGCGNTDFCPFDVFKERVVNPHLKHDFNSICNVQLDTQRLQPEHPIPPSSNLNKLIMFFHWLLTGKSEAHSPKQKGEL
ncbi:hypothetical protein QJS04_geneDACA005998 [Acorus gramineus]|uniref:Multiple inositol polyphosphate phosphatase 1 n=1 Tax=Acorus gramineus TaxID=55184 RepID=A0AAV9B649_ACOGR|nr:hypothetical protein QJS04_geneDACA005998 [Acorus gramineus]